jgi:hypothetical protein
VRCQQCGLLIKRLKLVAVVGGTAAAGAPIAAAVLLRPGGPGVDAPPTPTTASTPMSPSFPAPPRSATVFSRQLGANALALAVVPRRGGRLLLQASVLGSQGKGVAGLSVSFAVQGVTNAATPCGPGCYRTTLDTSGQPSSVQLEVRGRPATRWRVALPAAWPPRDASALVAGASNAWRSLPHSASWTGSRPARANQPRARGGSKRQTELPTR